MPIRDYMEMGPDQHRRQRREGESFDAHVERMAKEAERTENRKERAALSDGTRTYSQVDNIINGIDAVRSIAQGAEEVSDAMTREDLSQYSANTGITFIFGKTGDPKKDYKGGYGLSHIGAKHGEEAL